MPAGLLAQLLSNLIMNSLTHAFPQGSGGQLQVSAELLPDDRVRLVFADDGVGAPPEVRARMFEPFFTTRRGSGGSGLGLHIVYNIVSRLGGQLALLESERGLAVEVCLPQDYTPV